jgi:hypothetical protein
VCGRATTPGKLVFFPFKIDTFRVLILIRATLREGANSIKKKIVSYSDIEVRRDWLLGWFSMLVLGQIAVVRK